MSLDTVQVAYASGSVVPSAGKPSVDGAALYIDLLIETLINSAYEDPPTSPWSDGRYSEVARDWGEDWPSLAFSMIGRRRMENIRHLMEAILDGNVPGDFIETGVWRGGACILMRGILRARGILDRKVFLADSFAGLPAPDGRFEEDAGDMHHVYSQLAVPLETVQRNFRKFGLLDDQVVFVKGYFHETLHAAPIKKISLLRLDGDMYSSTMDALLALYDKVSIGGFIIVDDYISSPTCKKAIHDFLDLRDVTPTIIQIDRVSVYWRKIS